VRTSPSRRILYEYGDIIKIKPIFDVHLGAKACDEQAFKTFLEDCDDKTYFLGGGDLLDSIVTQDVRYRKSNDVTEGDAIVDEQIHKAVKLLYPYREKILGLASGNHEDVILKKCGTDPIRRICDELSIGLEKRVEYLGFSGLFKLKFRQQFGRGRAIVIRYHHGWGGGSRTLGADLTKFSKDIAYWNADIFLYGHVHRRQVDSVPRLGLFGDKMISKPQIICICGTFLKTYTSSVYPTYSEIKGYPPVEVGGVVVEIQPHRDWVKLRAYVG